MPEDDTAVLEFITKEKSYSELPAVPTDGPANEALLLQTCKQLTGLLLELEVDSLTETARRALKRTDTVLDEVLNVAKP
jgi:hypothetical protein